ncbi:MAG: hypothetical protein ACT443_02940 [Gemmatimonadota bacterium]
MTFRRASVALLLLLIARPGIAQDPLGWNTQRARELIERARERRELPRGDSTLRNYQASAHGYVYFYLDRREDDERTLVKVDQIALNLFWKRPNLTKQRIVGLRDVNRLPNRMYYHLDHLTVVQNNLGDVIRIGDGDEVRGVPHPAAPGADTIYDYRLADSVTLQLGGGQPDVRVYELQVRPKRTDRSALIGSVFVDRGSADIVRMTFTFTPASYVDRRLDYINISLDNGLFGGKYWLPNEQSVEIRRQIPELDFAAGAVIKGRLRVSGYTFNQPIPDSVFYGRPVTAAPEHERENFPFPEDIYAGVNAEGLAPPPHMEDLRERAAELIGETRLSGLPTWRLYIPNASSVLRHTNVEGWYAGLGVTYVPAPAFRVDATGGYAFGLEQPQATAAAHIGTRDHELLVRLYYNEPRDIGPVRAMPGVLNTITSAFGGDDYTNLYFARGASIESIQPIVGAWQLRFGFAREEHDAPYADTVLSSLDRNAQLVNAGTAYEVHGGVSKALDPQSPFTWGGSLRLSGIRFEPSARSYPYFNGERDLFGRLLIHVEARATSEDRRRDLFARAFAGRNISGAAAQYFFRVGGRETLPGYDFREFVSESEVVLARAEYSHTVAAPWLRLRALGYGGITNDFVVRPGDDVITTETSRNLRGSAGIGAGLLWDVLRIDVVKGAHWQTIFSVRHDFWDML